MRFGLVWDNWAKLCLATVGRSVQDPQRFTHEVAETERKILSNPIGAGWPWEEAIFPAEVGLDFAYRAGRWPGGIRIARVSETVIAISISKEDRTVWVWTIRLDSGVDA